MKVKVLESFKASLNGYEVITFEEGQELEGEAAELCLRLEKGKKLAAKKTPAPKAKRTPKPKVAKKPKPKHEG